MTRPSQKEYEKRHAARFLKYLLDYTSLDPSADEEKDPDIRVRRLDGDIGLEITEYHSLAPQGKSGRPRVANEATWWRKLWPIIDDERKKRPILRNIQAYVQFADSQLPGSAQCSAVAQDWVGAVEAVAKDARFQASGEIDVEFLPRADIESYGYMGDGFMPLPLEDWPEIANRLQVLKVLCRPLEWIPWRCLSDCVRPAERRACTGQGRSGQPLVQEGTPDQLGRQGPVGQAAEGVVARHAEGVWDLRWPRLDSEKPAPLGRARVRGQGDRLSERPGVVRGGGGQVRAFYQRLNRTNAQELKERER